MGKTVNPVWVQGHYRLRNDDGTLSTATYVYAEDTTGDIQDSRFKKYRILISWGESAGQTTSTASGTITMQFRINGGTWTTLTNSTAVQYVSSGTVGDATTDTTSRITVPTGVAAYVSTEFDSNNSASTQTPVDQGYEYEFCFQLDKTQLTDNDTIEFQLLNGGSTFSSVDAVPTFTYDAQAQALTQNTTFDDSTDTFYGPTVTPGAVALTQNTTFDDSTDTFYAASISQGGTQQDLTQNTSFDDSTDTFYAATVGTSITLTAGLVDDSTDTFYAATVTPGSVGLSATLVDDSTDTFYAASISQGGAQQDLTQSATFDDSTDTFYAATVGTTITLTAGLLDDSTDTFYSATVSQSSPQTLTQDTRFDDAADTFYVATVTGGAAAETPATTGGGGYARHYTRFMPYVPKEEKRKVDVLIKKKERLEKKIEQRFKFDDELVHKWINELAEIESELNQLMMQNISMVDYITKKQELNDVIIISGALL